MTGSSLYILTQFLMSLTMNLCIFISGCDIQCASLSRVEEDVVDDLHADWSWACVFGSRIVHGLKKIGHLFPSGDDSDSRLIVAI